MALKVENGFEIYNINTKVDPNFQSIFMIEKKI